MARQARAHATREAILAGAGVVFSEMSYPTATLAEVIRASGVTQGALYFHFDSKWDVAVEVIKRQHEIFTTVGTKYLFEEIPSLDALVLLSSRLATLITTDATVRAGLRLSTESSALFPQYASQPYLDWTASCELFLRRAGDEGMLVDDFDVEANARFLQAGFTGVQFVSQALSGSADLHARLEEMWSIIIPVFLRPEVRADAPRIAALARPA
jgi:TetR/AcrR family transcriptional repressor of uid operon